MSVVGVVALALGCCVGWIASLKNEPSLGVFSGPATEEDTGSVIFGMMNDQESSPQLFGDQRLVHSEGEFKAWVAIGLENLGATQAWYSVVCMTVEFPTGVAGGTCEPLADFYADGLSIPSPVEGDSRTFSWGPTGGFAVESDR